MQPSPFVFFSARKPAAPPFPKIAPPGAPIPVEAASQPQPVGLSISPSGKCWVSTPETLVRTAQEIPLEARKAALYIHPSFTLTPGSKVLVGADLRNVILRTVQPNGKHYALNLAGADLRNARLDNADLEDALLHGADLRRASLAGAKLNRIRCQANVDGENVGLTRFDGANLQRATVNGADFSGASFIGADLTCVDLSVAWKLTGAKFNRAILTSEPKDASGRPRIKKNLGQ